MHSYGTYSINLIRETNLDPNKDIYQGNEIDQLFESHQGDVFINVLNINITIIMIKIMNFTMSVNFNK